MYDLIILNLIMRMLAMRILIMYVVFSYVEIAINELLTIEIKLKIKRNINGLYIKKKRKQPNVNIRKH